jgi:hypothetical protein
MKTGHSLLLLLPALAMLPCSLLADAVVTAGSANVTIGEIFNVPVDISQVSDLYAFQFDLSYDPTILELLNVSEGSFLASAGTTFFIQPTVDNTSGTATATADSLIGAIPGADGNGDLAIFSFEAIAAGTSTIGLSNVTLLDSSLNPIPFTTTDGQVVSVSTVSTVPEPNCVPIVGLLIALAGLLSRKFAQRAR